MNFFNKMDFTLALAFVSLLTLSGCNTTPNNYLTKQATNKIGKTDVYITIPQKEITADIDKSQVAAAVGGGLLFALIDVAVESNRANTAEELIQPIKDNLLGVNFNQLFKEKLELELANITWLNINKIVFNHDLATNQAQTNFESSKSDAVLFVNASYSLSSDFSKLTAKANTSIIPKKESLKAFSEKPDSKKAKRDKLHLDNNIYRDNFSINESFAGAVTDTEANAKTLTENSELLKSLFPKIAERLAKDIVFSLQKIKVNS